MMCQKLKKVAFPYTKSLFFLAHQILMLLIHYYIDGLYTKFELLEPSQILHSTFP